MKHRPWPILLLSFLHMIEPVFRLGINWFYGIRPDVYLTAIYQGQFGVFKLSTLLLFPLAGYALYSFRKWSLPVFLFIEALVLAININYATYLIQSSQYSKLYTSLFFYLLNLGVVLYFLLPSVREVYENQKLRWWEASTRFNFELDCNLVALEHTEGKIAKVHTKNISRTGMFFESDDDLPVNSTHYIQFGMGKLHFKLLVKVIHDIPYNGHHGYGVKFVNVTSEQAAKLNDFCKALRLLGMARDEYTVDYKDEFAKWVRELVTTGKGITPIPKGQKLNKQPIPLKQESDKKKSAS